MACSLLCVSYLEHLNDLYQAQIESEAGHEAELKLASLIIFNSELHNI